MKKFLIPLLLLAILLLIIRWIFTIAEKSNPVENFEKRDATGALFREETSEPFPIGE